MVEELGKADGVGLADDDPMLVALASARSLAFLLVQVHQNLDLTATKRLLAPSKLVTVENEATAECIPHSLAVPDVLDQATSLNAVADEDLFRVSLGSRHMP